jgi:hypothetical protein
MEDISDINMQDAIQPEQKIVLGTDILKRKEGN